MPEWELKLAWGVALSAIGIGFTLLGVLVYLRHQSHHLKKVLIELHSLNQLVQQDVLDFIDQAWSVLSTARFTGLRGQVHWFGEIIEIHHGCSAPENHTIDIAREGIEIHLTIATPVLRGEDRLMAQLILQQFEILLTLDVTHKLSQFLLSQKRLERYQLFIQHDIKNIAQFISLLAEQFEAAQTDAQKLTTFNQVQAILPSMRDRALITVAQMTQESRQQKTVQSIDVRQAIAEMANDLGLNLKIEGDVTLTLSTSIFDQVIRTLLENFQHHSPQVAEVQVVIAQTGEITLASPTSTTQSMPVARMFEPFWTTSASGMGLGLYIARESLKEVGGQLKFYQRQGQNQFVVRFSEDKTTVELDESSSRN